MARYRKINGEWFKTASDGGGGDSKIQEYTLAEYEQIKDSIPIGTQFIIVDDYSDSGDIYSEEEQVIGRWIDGKPLYRKVLSTTNSSDIDLSDVNIEIITSGTGVWSNNDMIISMDYKGNSTSGYSSWNVGWFYDKTSKHITLQLGTNRTTFNKIILIIEYTKTTD